jgi:uncharacterized protein (DUF488 family)
VPLFTVGHGTRSTEELIAVLRDAAVARCVDVRRYPASRRHPHFARDALEQSLPAGAVEYEWWGETLGGRRRARPLEVTRHPAWHEESFRGYADYIDTDEFRRAFCALLDTSARTPTAVMCAETVWWRCHRRLIADTAVLQGVNVVHLGIGNAPRPHTLNPAVREDEHGWPVYDVGTQLALG